MGSPGLRVLIPQRLDVLARSMDSGITNMWLELGRHVDLVLWGPGLRGYSPGPLDAVAEHVDADLVLLPDLHHMTPELWAELWRGVTRVRRPVAMFMSDPGAAVPTRRSLVEQIRPAALLLMASRAVYHQYDDLVDALGIRTIEVPLGHDPHLCYPPPAGAGRDIDILVSGAEHPEAYPVRSQVKRVARALADRHSVLDLGHPGYWQLDPAAPAGRGQSLFADLLRRSRLAVTGTTWGIVSQKYFEAAACGAVGVGDLSPGDEAGPFREAVLAVEPGSSDATISAAIEALLVDARREERMRAAGLAAMRDCAQPDRAAAAAAALADLVEDPGRSRRPRPFPAPAEPLRLLAPADPEAVPSGRRDWVDVWSGGGGASRTRRVARALDASDAEVCVIALDPDAALPADALYLAERWRAAGRGVVMRAARSVEAPDPVCAGWALLAARRDDLRTALAGRRGRSGLEEAVLELIARDGVELLPEPTFDDVASELCRIVAASRVETHWSDKHVLALQADAAAARALATGRPLLAAEIAGWSAATLGRPPLELPAVAGGGPPQDPELHTFASDADVVVWRFREPGSTAALLERAAADAPLQIAVPASAGIALPEAAERLLAEFGAGGVDLERCDLALLERPLWEAEISWLLALESDAPSR